MLTRQKRNSFSNLEPSKKELRVLSPIQTTAGPKLSQQDIIEEWLDEIDIARLRIKHHANWHRKNIDRTKVLAEIAEVTGWRGLKKFAEFLGVSKMMKSKYLPQEYKKKKSGPKRPDIKPPLISKETKRAVKALSKVKDAVETSSFIPRKKRKEVLATVEEVRKTIAETIKEVKEYEPEVSQTHSQILE